MKYNRGLMRRPVFAKSGGSNRIEETTDQKELARIAFERWGNYQETFVPAEDKYISEVMNYDKPSRANAVETAATASVQDAASDAWQEQSGAMTRAGIDPSSGAFQSAITKHAINTGRAQSDVVNQSAQALQDQRVTGMKNVVAMGNGQAADAMAGIGAIADSSARQAADRAVRKDQRRASTHEAIGAVAGGATRAAIEFQE